MEPNRRKKPWSTNSWPDDIIADILQRSPVKSLLRFKCLSKHWYTLIANPTFISNHLYHSHLKQHSAIFTCRWDLQPYDRFGVSIFLHDNMLFPQHSDDNPSVLPINTVMGSSNGLILFGNSNDYILWNPAMRQSRRLPAALTRWLGQEMSATGFGYVPELNDYKLFRFLEIWDYNVNDRIEYTTKADVFSLKTGCWKQIENVPHCCCAYEDDSVIMNGVWYHLMVEYDDGGVEMWFILFFEFKDEVFGRIELPDGFQKQCRKLIVYKDSLAVVAIESETGHVWIMENNSWTKVITIGPFLSLMSVIGIWSNTQFLVTKRDNNSSGKIPEINNLWLYDPLNQTLKEVATNGEQAFLRALNYVESLVSVDDLCTFEKMV